jgi:hypothetical protein
MPEQRSVQQLRAEIARERARLTEALGELRVEAAWGGQRLALAAGVVVAVAVVGKLVSVVRRR